MTYHGWQEIIGVAGIFTLLTVAVWQFAATWRAKAVLAREREYRKLVESGVKTQENTESLLSDLRDQLTRVQSRLDSVEHVLKDVE